MSDHDGEKPGVEKPDVEKLWQEINQALDANDDLDIDSYLANKGVVHAPGESINERLKNILNHTFTDTEVSDEQFQGKYKITEQIDSGGQSDIYLAERSDGVYQQTVVIKFISQRFDQSALKQQFLQEMQLLADLTHPGVVTIIDGGVTDHGQPWLVLDYIEGPHIDFFCQQNQLTTQDVIGLMMSLCDALQFVHKRDVLHKDLKPSNILVKSINGVPHPVLIDFGIAKQADAADELNYGTRGFSAPEQIAGEALDQRSDLFSLGVVMGHLLLQAVDNQSEISDAIAMRNALNQSAVAKDLKKVVFQLTAPEKHKRYQNVDALRSDLNQWLLGFPLSFDNHKVSAVLNKTVKRHPWATLALALVLGAGVFFTAKYTRDVQHLQQLTVAEKNATDELMNFMLNDLYENLERIGRIDVLQSVAEKSVAHLSRKDPKTLDAEGHFQSAKAYLNTGRVFDYLEQSEQAQQMFKASGSHLNQAKSSQIEQTMYLGLLAKLRVSESQVLSSAGQEQTTTKILQEAIDAMQQLAVLDDNPDLHTLWEARLGLSYHLMEYAQEQRARTEIMHTIELSKSQLSNQPNDADWLFANSQSLQLKAWYELDFGKIEAGITDTLTAIEYASLSIEQDPKDIKKLHNERILYNQLAYFYLEVEKIEAAKLAVLKAIMLGDELKLKAPFNQEFEREHAYSNSTAGEIFQSQNNPEQALKHYLISLAVTERNFENDSQNYSAANDLAVDKLLVADLLKKTGKQKQARGLFEQAEALMAPVYQAEPNNKYYTHTYLVTQLQLNKLAEAKPLFEATKANDMVDAVITGLLLEHDLAW